MGMLTQLAVSIAFDLGLHHDVPTNRAWRIRAGRSGTHSSHQPVRTMEERRTILAVFHLTSSYVSRLSCQIPSSIETRIPSLPKGLSNWTAYRKTDPLRWTTYMDNCLEIIMNGLETELDSLLAVQVKCHLLTNQLITLPSDEQVGEPSAEGSSTVLINALLGQLQSIERALPAHLRSNSTRSLCSWISKSSD
jgi:hypothetical protein